MKRTLPTQDSALLNLFFSIMILLKFLYCVEHQVKIFLNSVSKPSFWGVLRSSIILQNLVTALSSESITSFVFYRFLVKSFSIKLILDLDFILSANTSFTISQNVLLSSTYGTIILLKNLFFPCLTIINFTLKFCCLLYTFRSWSLFEVKNLFFRWSLFMISCKS